MNEFINDYDEINLDIQSYLKLINCLMRIIIDRVLGFIVREFIFVKMIIVLSKSLKILFYFIDYIFVFYVKIECQFFIYYKCLNI